MHLFVRSLVTLAATAAFTAAVAPPAVAGPLGTCPHGQPICVYIPAATVPIGNPVSTGPFSQPVSFVELPTVCDASGTECVKTGVFVPGYYVESTGDDVAVFHFPGFGVGLDGTQSTIYVSPPTLTPTGTTLGLTVSVSEDTFVVSTNQVVRECENSGPASVGPVTTQTTSCVTTVTFSV